MTLTKDSSLKDYEQGATTATSNWSELTVRELVSRSIEALPEAYRTVLVLRDIEGFDTEETAELVGTTAGAVKTKLHRARSALKKLLEPVMRGEPL